MTRADLHCHSTASEIAKLGVQRTLGLPECATPPDEVYELAKRRGMDFVTITDHDTIEGGLQLADLGDFFVSEELTTRFPGGPYAVHVLCWGITLGDHEWLQAHAGDVFACAHYLRENEIACALAHPFFHVEAPLTPQHRRTLAELFEVWETRNGSRAQELNNPAVIYNETRGGTGVGGSDDHAGVDIGRTYTEAPEASTPEEFLAHIRAGRVEPGGKQGGAAKWAHSALALAARSLGIAGEGPVDPQIVLRIAERVVLDGDARGGSLGTDLGPEDARRLLAGWLDSVDLDGGVDELIAHLQDDSFSHSALERRARRRHERRLKAAVSKAVDGGSADVATAALEAFAACMPVVPYVPAAAMLAREQAKLSARAPEQPTAAVIVDAIGQMHGVTHTIQQIRDRGVPGYEVEVIGTDAGVDRRLPAVAEVDVPFYAGLEVGIPTLSAVADAITQGRYQIVHLCSPGPAGIAAAVVARVMGLPVAASYHTELGAYARLRSGDAALEAAVHTALGVFYRAPSIVLSPSRSADLSLRGLGVAPERIGRWVRGVDVQRFSPALRDPDLLEGEVKVLYVGRLTKEKGLDLLCDAFLAARERDPRLHLTLAGRGPEEESLRERLGEHATFLGWVEGAELARVYASADVFLFASRTDTFGQVILESQASGLPVLAVRAGGPAELIADGATGKLVAADAGELARALCELAGRDELRHRLAARALQAVRGRSWDVAMSQLSAGWERARGGTGGRAVRVA
jgi:glycosyltransferase involved in cell wall biosynthesis/predicted metal-dependent phosphoesterase TrpH